MMRGLMNRRVFCLLVLAAFTTSTLAAQHDVVGRQIPRPRDRHLKDEVRPGDKSIVVIDTNLPPLTMTLPDDVSLTKLFFEAADGIVLARVNRRQGRVSPAGDWVQSDITATVIEVFKAPTAAIRANSRLTFVEEGGEAQISGVKITAIVPWVRPLELGQTYLMGLSVDSVSGRIRVSPGYELKDGRFNKLSRPSDRPDLVDRIERDLSEQVLVEFRDLARNSRP